MYRMLFKSRWIALGFVALTLVSVVTFVGEEGRDTTLTRLTKDLRAQQALGDAPSEDESAPAPRIIEAEPPVIQDFVPDEELVDDAGGMDPSPDEPDSSDDQEMSEDGEQQGDVIIIHH